MVKLCVQYTSALLNTDSGSALTSFLSGSGCKRPPILWIRLVQDADSQIMTKKINILNKSFKKTMYQAKNYQPRSDSLIIFRRGFLPPGSGSTSHLIMLVLTGHSEHTLLCSVMCAWYQFPQLPDTRNPIFSALYCTTLSPSCSVAGILYCIYIS